MLDCFPLNKEQASLEATYWGTWYFPSTVKPFEVTFQICDRHCEVVMTPEVSIRFYQEAQAHYLNLVFQGFQSYELSQKFNKFLAFLSDQYLRVPSL